MGLPRGAASAISFDYGHVLGGLDVDEVGARLVELGRPPADVVRLRDALAASYRAHDAAIATGSGHEQAWRALMAVLVAAADPTAGDATQARLVDALWKAQPTRNLWRHVPAEAHTLLRALAAARVPMAITSNSEGRVRELLEEVGIARYFAVILDSGKLGFAKPDARIFSIAAERLGAPIGRMVHVGDSETADIAGAKAAGAWAIRFDGFVPGARDRPTIADARTDDFDELRRLLSVILDTPLPDAPLPDAPLPDAVAGPLPDALALDDKLAPVPE